MDFTELNVNITVTRAAGAPVSGIPKEHQRCKFTEQGTVEMGFDLCLLSWKNTENTPTDQGMALEKLFLGSGSSVSPVQGFLMYK